MRYFQVLLDGGSHLAAETTDDTLIDLTAISPHVQTIYDLLSASAISGASVDRIATVVADRGGGNRFSLEELHENSMSGEPGPKLGRPFVPPEVWAVGVTYQDSMKERQAESGTPDVYAKVYTADRPEVFFKATPSRVVAPYDAVGIRADSEWNVPEPELSFVLFDGRIAGYTVGNDMSSRTIEGANPLYLPQAKVYDRACSIGPCFVTADSVPHPQDLTVRLRIDRSGEEAFSGSTSTSMMIRDCEYLADWLQRHNPVPDGTTVLTGTGVIPPAGFTLRDTDIITIGIDSIGQLVNPVAVV